MSIQPLLASLLLNSLLSPRRLPAERVQTPSASPRENHMIWTNAHCELLLKNGQVLNVTSQGVVLYQTVAQLPPSSARLRPLFGAAAKVLVLYADRKRYKAHIAAIRDYLLKGGIGCKFDSLVRSVDTDPAAVSLVQASLQLVNGDGDERSMQLSGYPAPGHFPVCLLLNTGEIDQSWTCDVLAFCIGDAISEVNMRSPLPLQATPDGA